jgi:hypothetical protein
MLTSSVRMALTWCRVELMRYQRVRWHQDSPDCPVVLYSEIDEDDWEVRKVDEYADGHRDLAASDLETGSTFLGLERIPSLEEINSDPQFEGVEITVEEFEEVWSKAKERFELPWC